MPEFEPSFLISFLWDVIAWHFTIPTLCQDKGKILWFLHYIKTEVKSRYWELSLWKTYAKIFFLKYRKHWNWEIIFRYNHIGDKCHMKLNMISMICHTQSLWLEAEWEMIHPSEMIWTHFTRSCVHLRYTVEVRGVSQSVSQSASRSGLCG